ncbi:hypothetical protein SUGI_0345250 [Cryptomeria japonica]|nr:hypothetical protein SUGI_0345250 [Cryptomeria japonica]
MGKYSQWRVGNLKQEQGTRLDRLSQIITEVKELRTVMILRNIRVPLKWCLLKIVHRLCIAICCAGCYSLHKFGVWRQALLSTWTRPSQCFELPGRSLQVSVGGCGQNDGIQWRQPRIRIRATEQHIVVCE